jgi:hypothetical protein
MEFFQATDFGLIPIARSISLDDSAEAVGSRAKKAR